MNNLYEVLEICLQEIEQGTNIETVLFRYPELADELRPILEGAVNAKSMAIAAPSAEVIRRNRARVLQHAAQLRGSNVKSSSRRIWLASLRRIAVTLAVVAALFISSTGLVRAASTTLPGDQLYPVKRTWEDVLVVFTFNSQSRQALEVEHENERVYEIKELFAKGRAEPVDFAGLVTSQNGNEWLVGGFPILISAQTQLPAGMVKIGNAVRVRGQTQSSGAVLAESIELLPPGAQLPDVGDDVGGDRQDHQGPNQGIEDNSGKSSEGEQIEGTNSSEQESGSKNESLNSGSGREDSSSSSNDSGKNPDSSSNDGSHQDSGGSQDSGSGGDG